MKQVQAYECSDGSAIVGKEEAESYERGLRLLAYVTDQIGTSTSNDGRIITTRKSGDIIATAVTLKFLAENWEELVRICNLENPFPARSYGATDLLVDGAKNEMS